MGKDIENLIEAVKYIAAHTRKESVKRYKGQDMLVNGVRHFLGYATNHKKWDIHKEEILDMIDEGFSQKKIAEHFGVCQASVSEALKRMGIKTERTDREWTEREVKWLEYYRKQGMTAYEMSHLLGRTKSAIQVKIRHLGLPKLTKNEISVIRKRTSFRIKKEEKKNEA